MESTIAVSSQTSHLPMAISDGHLQQLRDAYQALEYPSLASRLSNVVGTPIELALQMLPGCWYKRVHHLTEEAIRKALGAAVASMYRRQELRATETHYKVLVGSTGAVGGLLGLPGLIIELPLTTSLMLRGIAEIAREEGEEVHSPEALAACLEVFALGGRTEVDDAAETGYYGVRVALAGYMTTAMSHILGGGANGAAPAVVRLRSAIAQRFGVSLSQRAAARMLPVVGAVGAATVNIVFMQHFQRIARAHFTVRRLERTYGEEFIRSQYLLIEAENQARRSSR